MDAILFEDLARYVGQTVTIFTTSGGISGGGFTGVLIACDPRVVRLICDMGAPPACPIGSACTCGFTPMGFRNGFYGNDCGGGYGGYGGFEGFGGCGGFNPLGSVTVIPVHAIAAFTHNAI